MESKGILVPEPARVSATLTFTRNLGNFESVKVGFSAEDNVGPDETREDVAKRLYKEVDSWLEKVVNKIDAEHNTRG